MPRGCPQEPAGPEHKYAALQACSVPAAEESLLQLMELHGEPWCRVQWEHQPLLSCCLQLLWQPVRQPSCLTMSDADASEMEAGCDISCSASCALSQVRVVLVLSCCSSSNFFCVLACPHADALKARCSMVQSSHKHISVWVGYELGARLV